MTINSAQSSVSKNQQKGEEAWFLTGVFLMCMCGLMLQIMHTRIFSIISYYHMGFFAIGIAMLGMTAGALLVYLEKIRVDDCLASVIANMMSIFSWMTLFSLVILLNFSITPNFEPSLRFLIQWIFAILVLLPPYVFLGIGICLALTRSQYPVSRIYGVDLVGAAVGCLVTLGLLYGIDTYSAVMVVSALGAASAWFFHKSAQSGTSEETEESKWFLNPVRVLAIALVITAINVISGPQGLRPMIVKGKIEKTYKITEELWNSFSRVTLLLSEKSPPFLWSASPIAPDVSIEQGMLQIDGDAGTPIYHFTGNWDDMDFLHYDMTSLAYSIRNQGRSAVIGVGGGRDILTASLSGFRDVTGVDYNPLIIRLFGDKYRHYSGLDALPGRVNLVVDDARSWFARSREKFDLIQMSLVDTWAATGAGAFTLSENGLYTVDGWKRFIARLTPNGIFTVSRWSTPGVLTESGRIVSLAMATLIEEGVSDPADHIFLTANGMLSTLIVSRSKLSETDLSTLSKECDRLHYQVLIDPRHPPEHPVLKNIISAKTIPELIAIGQKEVLDLAPTWDRNPFFFNQVRLANMALALALINGTELGNLLYGNLTATFTLFTLIAISIFFTVFILLLPTARLLPGRQAPIMVWGSGYFLLIGLGFIFAEIGLIQRTSIFLGHPIYGLAIALFGIIISTGIGSLLSERLMSLKGLSLTGWPIVLAINLIALPFWFPVIMHHFESSSLLVRSAVSLLGIVPSGFLMGFMFPTGMRLVECIDRKPMPWFWAINGSAGVLGSGMAVLFSIQTSLDATLTFAAACYALLSVAAFKLGSFVPSGPKPIE